MTSRLGPPRRDRGQVLVIFALGLVGLLAAAGIAVDIGRFYSERRFLQNAADAAALAAANALIRGESNASADADARDVLARNFIGDPNATTPSPPPATPVYDSGYAGDPSHLSNGIIISGGDVRVAVTNTIGYTFGRVIGLGSQPIVAQSHVKMNGDLLPIAVRQFVNAPGPNNGATSPCPDDQTRFTDFFATADTACLGTDSDASLRTVPTAGSAFDSTNPASDSADHGPVMAILGQGAQPSNGADFRGFVALDIRNFATATSQLYYNGVTPSTNPSTLKSLEAGWITAGYPGPMFPSVVSPPDPNDQVAIMSGNSTGVAITAMTNRFIPGDEILVAVYNGSVMSIPDFAMSPPQAIALPTSGTVANAGSMKVSKNQAFSGSVTLSTLADTNDPANPLVLGTMTGAPPITYTPNPVTPSLGSGTNVALSNITTSGATPGIYALWVQGQAGSPYLTTKLEPFSVVVGSVTRDFTIVSDVATQTAVNAGDSVAFNLTLQNAPNRNTNFGGPVTLSVDGPLPTGFGAATFGSTTVTPSKAGASTSLTVATGTVAPGTYRIIVRATGLNADTVPRSVTHLLPLTINVGTSGSSGNQQYVDISGFAVMRVAAVGSNTISAYAISPVIADMNDPRLSRGQVARLVPWN